jgi:hypothetical protein
MRAIFAGQTCIPHLQFNSAFAVDIIRRHGSALHLRMNEHTSKPPQSITPKCKGLGLRILGYVLLLLSILSYILWLIEDQTRDRGEGYDISRGIVLVLNYGPGIAVLLGLAGAACVLFSFLGNQKDGNEKNKD